MRAVVAAFLADAITFAVAIVVFRIPIGAELNPTMVAAYLAAGLAGVVVWKAVLLVALVGAILRVRTRPRRIAILLAWSISLFGAASNVVAILRSVA